MFVNHIFYDVIYFFILLRNRPYLLYSEIKIEQC
jgi:hypothetical protein